MCSEWCQLAKGKLLVAEDGDLHSATEAPKYCMSGQVQFYTLTFSANSDTSGPSQLTLFVRHTASCPRRLR